MENSAPIVPEAPVRLWLPGLGVTDLSVRKVARAVKQYDETLNLARHEITGDWVVVKGDDFPVFGFGPSLPNPDDVDHILGRHDISRHGKEIMAHLASEAAKRRDDELYRGDQNDEASAEAMAQFYAKHGDRSAPRIFVPRGV